MDDRSDEMPTPQATGLTIADLEAMPEDMVIRTLIDGELFVSPAPTVRHQRVVGRVYRRLAEYGDAHGGEAVMAPCAVRFSDRDVVEPDVLYITAERLDRMGEHDIDGPPNLVVEVSSPSTRRFDLVRKRRLYERFEVPEYWFVDLDADRIEAYVLADGRYRAPVLVECGARLRSVTLPGFEASVDDLLAL